jgi:hypothetical protein
MYSRRLTQMVTNIQEGIEIKDVVIIVRVGGIIIIMNSRTMLTMIDQITMMVRASKKSGR